VAPKSGKSSQKNATSGLVLRPVSRLWFVNLDAQLDPRNKTRFDDTLTTVSERPVSTTGRTRRCSRGRSPGALAVVRRS
jgi:hypothetical protein